MTTSTSRRSPRPWTSQASPTPTPVPISRTRPPPGTAAASAARSLPTSTSQASWKPALAARSCAARTLAGSSSVTRNIMPSTGDLSYSALRTAAIGVRAAACPGAAAMRFATTSAAGMAMKIAVSGAARPGSTPSWAASKRHAHRPTATPAGSPMSSRGVGRLGRVLAASSLMRTYSGMDFRAQEVTMTATSPVSPGRSTSPGSSGSQRNPVVSRAPATGPILTQSDMGRRGERRVSYRRALPASRRLTRSRRPRSPRWRVLRRSIMAGAADSAERPIGRRAPRPPR